VARLASTILTEYAAAPRKIKDTATPPDATADWPSSCSA
jgi:ATP-dependent helicase HrpA